MGILPGRRREETGLKRQKESDIMDIPLGKDGKRMMKRAMAFFLLLALLLTVMALADDTVVAWSDIAAQIETKQSGTVGDLVDVRIDGST